VSVVEVVIVVTIVVVGRLRLRQLQAEESSAKTKLLKQAGTDTEGTAVRLTWTVKVVVTVFGTLPKSDK